MKNEFGFVFNKENCIQCLGCETACKSWRKVELGVRWRRVFNVWEGEYPNVKCGALMLSCQHCAEPECERVCPVDAIKKRADGAVLVDTKKCIGCRACFEACPFDVPQFGADGHMQKCDMCLTLGSGDVLPPCVRTCPTHALELKKMSPEEKKEREALLAAELKKITGNS